MAFLLLLVTGVLAVVVAPLVAAPSLPPLVSHGCIVACMRANEHNAGFFSNCLLGTDGRGREGMVICVDLQNQG
jgi:hypothetical protein